MSSPASFSRGRPERFLPNLKLKFLDQCREVMRFKQLSHRTEETLKVVEGAGRGF